MKFYQIYIEAKAEDSVLRERISDHADLYDKLSKYFGRDDYFISFRDRADDMYLNKANEYDTPHGFYCYPLDNATVIRYFNKDTKEASFPFAGEREYVYVIKKKPGARVLQLDLKYKEHDLNIDKKKIKWITAISNDEIESADKDAKRQMYPAGRLWNVTRIAANKNPLKWNRLFRKLGYDYAIDPGNSIIHYNEPYQAVFFTPSFEIVSVLKNVTINKSKENVIKNLKNMINSGRTDLIISYIKKHMGFFEDELFQIRNLLTSISNSNLPFNKKYQTIINIFDVLKEEIDKSDEIASDTFMMISDNVDSAIDDMKDFLSKFFRSHSFNKNILLEVYKEMLKNGWFDKAKFIFEFIPKKEYKNIDTFFHECNESIKDKIAEMIFNSKWFEDKLKKIDTNFVYSVIYQMISNGYNHSSIKYFIDNIKDNSVFSEYLFENAIRRSIENADIETDKYFIKISYEKGYPVCPAEILNNYIMRFNDKIFYEVIVYGFDNDFFSKDNLIKGTGKVGRYSDIIRAISYKKDYRDKLWKYLLKVFKENNVVNRYSMGDILWSITNNPPLSSVAKELIQQILLNENFRLDAIQASDIEKSQWMQNPANSKSKLRKYILEKINEALNG